MFLCIKCKFLEITLKKNQSNQKIRTIYKRIAFRSSLEIGNIKLLIKYKSILFYIFIYSKQHLTSLLENISLTEELFENIKYHEFEILNYIKLFLNCLLCYICLQV